MSVLYVLVLKHGPNMPKFSLIDLFLSYMSDSFMKMFCLVDISSLFLTRNPTQGYQLFSGLMQQAGNVFIHMQQIACQITEHTQDRVLMAKVVQVYQRKQTNFPPPSNPQADKA